MNPYSLLLACLLLTSTLCQAQPRVVGYLPTWGDFDDNLSKINFSTFTHINLAFANPDETGTVSFTDLTPAQVSAVVSKCHEANTKIAVSIGGGAADTDLWLSFMHGESMEMVVTSLISLVETYEFDGIDVDLEGDLVLSEHYKPFVVYLHDQLPSEILYTAALANWSAGGLSTDMLLLYDFVNVMSYDYTGPWAPYQPGPHSSYQQALSDMNYWKNTKMLPVQNIVLGVPFYGYDFQDQSHVYYVSYKEIVSTNAGAENTDKVGNTYYNGLATIKSKTELSLQYGGIMIWEITQDVDYTDDRSLLAAIMNVIDPVVLAAPVPNSDPGLYPNPVTDFLTITLEYKPVNVIITDLQGKVVLDRKLKSDHLDVRMLQAGTYLVSVRHEQGETKLRFIKQ